MIINNNIQAVTGAYSVSQTAGTRRTSQAAGAREHDEVLFSSEATSFSSMLQKLRSMDEPRTEKIQALSRQVEDGSYTADAQKIAASILNTRY